MALSRRTMILGTAAGLASHAAGERLAPWQRGFLDIHHISTGVGSSTFLLGPDGATLLIDCGEYVPPAGARQYIIGAKPDGSRRAGEWVARYCARRMRAAKREEIDTFLATHLHGDHVGDSRFHEAPRSRFGEYVLTGISDLAETLPVRRILDRGYPDYSYPHPLEEPQELNYRAFVKSFASRGGRVERFRAGSSRQITISDCVVRNLAVNGEVWTGEGESTRKLFQGDDPTENMCSAAVRIQYGRFSYYAGGDLTCDTNYGKAPWRDVETPVAQACGPVDVAAANHHGYVDATGPGFVAALRPRVFVVNAWDASHPSAPAMNAMLSRDLYPGDRDIFATAMKPETKIAVRQVAQMKSDNGHVVVRVYPGGERYEVIVTSNADESDTVWQRLHR